MKAGIIGYPIEHSLSPRIYESLARRSGARIDYQVFSFPEGELEERWKSLSELDGLNVTSPYKQTMMSYCASLSPEATRVGAVNVMAKKDGAWIGHNSDIAGFRDSLLETGRVFRSAAVFGSGGAARAAIAALDDLGAEKIHWVSRDPEKLESEGMALNERAVVELCGYEEKLDVDLYVNATPVGMTGRESGTPYSGPFRNGAFAYEMIYSPEWTEFRKLAREQGCETQGGLDMLVHQALRCWRIWGMPELAEPEEVKR